MKQLKKMKLNEKDIISRFSNGDMKHLVGGYDSFDKCVAGCGCSPTHTACTTCQA